MCVFGVVMNGSEGTDFGFGSKWVIVEFLCKDR
jgi:hypothetical protein